MTSTSDQPTQQEVAQPPVTVIDEEQWRHREELHQRRVDEVTREHRHRRAEGRSHPVEDFLFTYYSFPPGRLRRWHCGPGVVLLGQRAQQRAAWRWYRAAAAPVAGGGRGAGAALDVEAFLAERGATVDFVMGLLAATDARPAHLGCFGLHEWAMVYRCSADQLRHSGLPLRLGRAGTDAVVESHSIRCSHYDAYRFFTAAARPRNRLAPTRADQVANEQPGCLHANMDLYKWAYKLSPAIPSELVVDCFELARDVRVLDMRASPYDLSEYGYSPVPIETSAGKADYIAQQREFAERAGVLRRRLLHQCRLLLAHGGVAPGEAGQR
ncbi:3-methyladenine DNA glycosylase [Salinactinospora qingdaonensis]|uniref:3-methyladenine DNA glycosylase n=1 Tax=Salinactinospora qingdaonensis TaxID=702744 RepID=A0ABP7FPX8_9ACTN